MPPHLFLIAPFVQPRPDANALDQIFHGKFATANIGQRPQGSLISACDNNFSPEHRLSMIDGLASVLSLNTPICAATESAPDLASETWGTMLPLHARYVAEIESWRTAMRTNRTTKRTTIKL